LTIDRCSFVGAIGGARAGIAIEVNSTTTLAEGGFLANTSTGGVDRSIWLLVTNGASVSSTFGINDNDFSGYGEAGIYLHALGSGALLSTATISCKSNGNFLTGTGATENGYHFRAEHGVLNQGAVVSPWILYGRITGNNVNVFCETVNNGASEVDIAPDFYGNRIENAIRAGVELTTLVPVGGNDNNDPDFGPGHTGRYAGLNTFVGNATDFRIGAGVTNSILARFNFFPAGASSQVGGVPDTFGIMSETIVGAFASSVLPDEESEVQLNASSSSGFVDYSGSASVGQITVTVDGTDLDQADIEELALGGGLMLQLPALEAGSIPVEVTNPGGQTGSFTLNVTAGGSGSDDGGGNDCFVATAAHGNYRSNEVIALRRFRDQYLKASPAGRSFVDWYYDNGPTAAAFLLENEWARKSSRVALAVPVAVANGLTSWNPGQRFAFAVVMLGLVFRLTRRRQ